jgi:hypothetical protein
MSYTTYSFKDTKGSITNSEVPPFIFQGQIGLVRITVRMTTPQSAQNVASDGTIMQSAIAGDNGTVEIEVQQTSDLHAWLLALYNILKTQKLTGNVTNWFGTALYLVNTTDGTTHVVTGIGFEKIPDKPYAAQGQTLVWNLMAGDSQQVTL